MEWRLVSIVLSITVMLESAFIIWIFHQGSQAVYMEEMCIYECDELGYDVYNYDLLTNQCFCVDENLKWNRVDINA